MPKGKLKRRSKSKTGFFGVTKLSSGKYRVQIKVNGRNKYLGSTYDTAKQAAKAYDKEAIKLRRPFSKLNYPKKAPVGYTPMQQALRSTNTVGYRGISKHGKNYRASITSGSKQQNIGTYDTAKEAAIAYDFAVLKANRSTSLLNFPGMVHNLDGEPKRKKYKRSLSGYRGVSETSGRYLVRLCFNSTRTTIGTFDSPIQGALAYDRALLGQEKNKRKSKKYNFNKDDYKYLNIFYTKRKELLDYMAENGVPDTMSPLNMAILGISNDDAMDEQKDICLDHLHETMKIKHEERGMSSIETETFCKTFAKWVENHQQQ